MIKILHTNDIHSNIHNSIELFEYLHQEKKNDTLTIDLGDFFQGNSFYNLFKGKPERKLLLKTFDIVVPGNHGFNEYLKVNSLKKKKSFVLCCNIFRGKYEVFDKYLEMEFANTKLGFIGIMSEDCFNSIELRTRKNYSVMNPFEIVEGIISEIRYKIDYLFILSHSGVDFDVKLAKSLKGIDFILSSHCHSSIKKIKIGKTIIKKSLELGKGVGIIEINNNKIKLSEKTFNHMVMDYTNPKLTFLNPYLDLYDKKSSEIITIIPQKRIEWFSTRENLMTFFIELIAGVFNSNIYLFNLTTIRSGISDPNLSTNDLYNILPFENSIIKFSVSKTKFNKCIKQIPSDIRKYLIINIVSEPKLLSIITTSYLYNNYFAKFITKQKYIHLASFRTFISEQLKNIEFNKSQHLNL